MPGVNIAADICPCREYLVQGTVCRSIFYFVTLKRLHGKLRSLEFCEFERKKISWPASILMSLGTMECSLGRVHELRTFVMVFIQAFKWNHVYSIVLIMTGIYRSS